MTAELNEMVQYADAVATRSYLASGSPPIVDFMRFEHRYRSPSNDYDALFSVPRGTTTSASRRRTFL